MPLRRGRTGGSSCSGVSSAPSCMPFMSPKRPGNWDGSWREDTVASKKKAARKVPCGSAWSTQADSVLRLVHQAVLLDPRHHRAQLLADLFDRVLGRQAATRQQ